MSCRTERSSGSCAKIFIKLATVTPRNGSKYHYIIFWAEKESTELMKIPELVIPSHVDMQVQVSLKHTL